MQLGPFLQQCRQQSGHSIEDLAEQLRITPKQLESLENDQFDLFASEDELKAVLTECAELVDLSPSAILRLYQRQVQEAAAGTIFSAKDEPKPAAEEFPLNGEGNSLSQPVPTLVRRTPRRKRRKLPVAGILIMTCVGLLALFLWMNIEPPAAPPKDFPTTYEPIEFMVIPERGGMIRIVTTEVHEVKVVIDDREEKVYRMEAGSGIRLQVRQEAVLTWEQPGGVALFFNEIPLPINQQTQAHLLPAPENDIQP